MSRPETKETTRRPWTAPLVLAMCGTLWGLAPDASAQTRRDDRRQNARNFQPGGQDVPSTDAQDAMVERLRQLREEQRQLMLRQQAGDESVASELARVRTQINRIEQRSRAFGGAGLPGESAPASPLGNPDEGGVIRGELAEGGGTVELAFPGGGVALEEFINWIQRVLDINIISRAEVRGQEVVIGEPLEFQTDQLLDLLSALLARDGLSLFKHEIGFYEIMPAANLPPVFREGELNTTRVIPTPLLQPTATLAKITEALGNSAQQVRISAMDDLGVLLVTGTPSLTQTVENLVERYVEERSKIELFTYSFENVSAEYARDRILSLYERLTSTGGRNANPGGAVTSGGGLSSLSEKLILDQGNTLIFRGRPAEWPLVERLAERVDVVTTMRHKRYIVGSIAQDVVNAGQSLGLGSVRQSSSGSVFRGGVGSSQRGIGGTSSEDPALSSGFALDAEGGSFLYFGTDAQHEMVDRLVDDFDDQSEKNRVTIETYKLHHVPAEDMAALLNEILQDPTQQNQFGGSPFLPGSRQNLPTNQPVDDQLADVDAAPAEGGEGEGFITATADDVVITANESRNLILVRATPRNQREIQQIIEKLDQRQPQVLIEAQIVSVTVEDDFTFSADVQLSAGQFEFLSTFGVTNLANDLTLPNTVQGATPGLTSAFIRSDFVPIAINALETIGDAKLISNPRVLVNDNEDAEVASEREEPFSSTTQGTATTVTSQGGTATAGTQLSVTPQISAGGYLVLEYSIELSAFEGVGQGGLQPPRQTENYDSIVTIPSDTTIIVGGFVSTRDTENVSQIPLIGDIPLIGELFKSKTTSKEKRLIFVFITPRILDDPNFRDLRLATEGPLKDVGLEGIVPELMPAGIPIKPGLAMMKGELGVNRDESDLLLGTDDGITEIKPLGPSLQ